MLDITFLGTGTSQGVPVINCPCDVCQSEDPRDKRLRSSISISDGDKNIVIDVGPDFRTQLLRNPLSRIDAVFITHEHNDHVAGMDDLRPFNFLQQADIPVFACERVIKELKVRFYYAFMDKSYPGAPGYQIKPIKHGDTWEVGNMKCTAFEVMHGNLPIICYRINDFVYITDAKTISESSREIIRGCQVMVVNALRRQDHWSHHTLGEAVNFTKEIGAPLTYFTHMSHLMGQHSIIENQLPKGMMFAQDGLAIKC